jgi:hypothetical protein
VAHGSRVEPAFLPDQSREEIDRQQIRRGRRLQRPADLLGGWARGIRQWRGVDAARAIRHRVTRRASGLAGRDIELPRNGDFLHLRPLDGQHHVRVGELRRAPVGTADGRQYQGSRE